MAITLPHDEGHTRSAVVANEQNLLCLHRVPHSQAIDSEGSRIGRPVAAK